MWKWIKKWRTDGDFLNWAKAMEKKLKGEVREQFKESWPVVRNNAENVRASYVLYWEMRASGGTPVHQIAQPMAIAYLAYLGDGAQAIGREDLAPVINNMVINLPRLHAEIMHGVIEGAKNEEE